MGSQNTPFWGSFHWPGRRTFLKVAQKFFDNTEQTLRRQGKEETGNEEREKKAEERWFCSQTGNLKGILLLQPEILAQFT